MTVIELVGSFFARLTERATVTTKALFVKSGAGLAIRAIYVGWEHKPRKFFNSGRDYRDEVLACRLSGFFRGG